MRYSTFWNVQIFTGNHDNRRSTPCIISMGLTSFYEQISKELMDKIKMTNESLLCEWVSAEAMHYWQWFVYGDASFLDCLPMLLLLMSISWNQYLCHLMLGRLWVYGFIFARFWIFLLCTIKHGLEIRWLLIKSFHIGDTSCGAGMQWIMKIQFTQNNK